METATETKFGTKVAYGMRMMPELRIHAYRKESTQYHTLTMKNDIRFSDDIL